MVKADILLLDVDGVVTDRYARVSMPVVLELLRLSRSGVKMAFITGRSERWVKDNILEKIPKTARKGILFLCEFGSVVVGRKQNPVSMPAKYVRKSKRIAKMFPTLKYDSTKKTMISVEGSLWAEGGEEQLAKSEKLLREMVKGDGRFRVLRSTYAVDVLDRRVGKGKAARFALRKFGALSPIYVTMGEGGGAHGRRVVVLGDSAADIDMAVPGCIFYYVGPGKPKGGKDFRMIVTRKKFSGGALSILKKMAALKGTGAR